MSKPYTGYILFYGILVVGILTNKQHADRWTSQGMNRSYRPATIDDPELLNQIAKESEVKK
jgi:hypothetical protein